MGLFSKKEKKEKTKLQFKHIDGLSLNRGDIVAIEKLEDEIIIKAVLSKYEIKIGYNAITNIVSRNYTEEEIKNKSVVGRALVGGVLTGGIGAVIGGMSGVGNKSKSKTIPAFEIFYIKNGIENTILLEDYWLLGTKKFMDSIKEKADSIPKLTIENDTINTNIDIPEQIKKLADLKEQGILTEIEFNSKKQELLSKM